MSCQIRISANIVDIPSVRRCLYPMDDMRGSENWLQNCLISISPTGEIIVIANCNKIVVLSAKWDSNAVLSQYHVTYSGALDNPSDIITSVLCLPIVSQSQSTQVGPDWTCIAVGFQSGYVKFYTDSCRLLLSEQLHNDKVCSIKCQSQYCSHLDASADVCTEEIYIQYPTNVCVLTGSQLFSSLRNCRSQLARDQTKFHNLESTTVLLCPKKWGFVDQASVNDAVVVGLDASNTFNHLLTASTCGGFDTKYRAMAPNNTLVMGAGVKPYVGFHFALEGGSQPILSDVAKAVANKLKSALPGWLIGNKSSSEKQQSVTIQPAEAMGCRFGLCDLRRHADAIILSPNKKLSVVTDSMGRIALIDNYKGVAVRLWKGYRGAQCSFLQVPDEEKNKHKHSKHKTRLALFLVIYIPKKGTIEIWALQQGPKIVTFSASKNSKLLYTNYGLVGYGSQISKIKNIYHFSSVLIDPDGQIKEIIVPFHFSLAEKNSKRARDLHLYKRLKQFLKTEDYNLEKLCSEVGLTCSELKTNEIRLQCFEMIISSKHIVPRAALLLAETFLEKLSSYETPDPETKRLITLSNNLKSIVNLYMFVEDDDIDAENGNVNNNVNDNEKLEEIAIDTRLIIAEKELNNFQRLLDLTTLNDGSSEVKVSFNDGNKSTFTEYLSIFDLNSENGQIVLKKDVHDEKLYSTAEKLFGQFVTSLRDDIVVLQEQIGKSTVSTLDLIKLLLNYWVNRQLPNNVNLEKEMQNLSRILRVICLLNINDNICADYNKESPFWRKVRDYLADASKPFPALTAAILCRGIAQRIEQEKELQQCSATSLEDESNPEIWEKLSHENCQWTLLIGKLEDISLLNIILANKPIVTNSCLPCLTFEKVAISLKYVLQKGRGSVSELVGQWLTTAGFNPEWLVLNDMSIENEEEVNPEKKLVDQVVFEHFNMLKKQFPYSLNTSAIIANMCWEYMLSWQKMRTFKFISAAFKCLAVIPNSYIKQGLFNLIWTTHLKQIFESTCKLINKVGKVPKEILCKQDTGLSDLQLVIFVNSCTEFLDLFIDAVQQNFGVQKPELTYENIWEENGVPLTELTIHQSEINDNLLFIHYQLSLVIQMITTFRIKHTKPVTNLFDNLTVNLFFIDFTQKSQVSTHSSDSKLLNSRSQFLIKVIDASIETVTIIDNNTYSVEHVNWMSKCVLLASIWGIDTDMLRRHQVRQLYTSGFIGLADELLPSISDVEKIGPELLKIAGKQLKQMLKVSRDLTEKIVAISPSFMKYLETLDCEWCAPGTIESIHSLAKHAARCLSETHALHKNAGFLLDVCTVLEDMDN